MGAGSSQTATTSPSFNITNQSTAPWSAQQPYLTSAWNDAQNNYNNQSSTPYTGSFAAGPVSQQYSAYGDAYNNAAGNEGNVQNQINTGGALTGQGTANTQGTINDLGYFGAANNASNLGSQASQIASGYNVPGEVAAATNQAQQLANESTIPNLYRQSAAGGDINSSQSALAQGVVEQGLAENAQNLGATLSNANYGTGLSTAQNMSSQDLTALQAAGLLGTGQTNSGINATNSGIANQTANNLQEVSGANGVQNLNQLTDTSNLQNYLGPQSIQNQQLAALYSIIGSGNWGSQSSGTSLNSGSTTTTQQNPSLLSTLGAGTGILGSLVGNGTTTASNGTTTTNNGLLGQLGSLSSLGSFLG